MGGKKRGKGGPFEWVEGKEAEGNDSTEGQDSTQEVKKAE